MGICCSKDNNNEPKVYESNSAQKIDFDDDLLTLTPMMTMIKSKSEIQGVASEKMKLNKMFENCIKGKMSEDDMSIC